MTNLIQVNRLSFKIIKQGQTTIGKTDIIVIGTRYVNPRYITSITPETVDSTTLYYVTLCKLSLPGLHDFYTDQAGLDLLTTLIY